MTLRRNLSSLPLIVLSLGIVWLTATQACAAPKDWHESDWVKFIEWAVTSVTDSLAGGLKAPLGPGPTAPLFDVYAAVGAAGSSVQPGLTLWLQGKMRAAQDAGDYDRLDGYQAYYTALTTGDKTALKAHFDKLQKKAQKATASSPKGPRSLVLNNLVVAKPRGLLFEVVPQFTVGGNQAGQVKTVSVWVMVRGPLTSYIEQREVPLPQPEGYQAVALDLSLPDSSRSGQYTVALKLSTPGGLTTEIRKAQFQYEAPKPPHLRKPPETKVPPPIEDPPEPTPPRRTLRAYSVEISGPTTAKTGQRVSYSPVLSGEPAGTVSYTWRVNGKTVKKPMVNGKFDTPGTKTVSVVAADGRGREVRSQLQVKVEASTLRVQLSGPGKTPVGKLVTLSCQVRDGIPPYTYHWRTDGKTWRTPSVTLDYDRPGSHTATVEVEDDRGAKGRGILQIRVTDGIAINTAGPRTVKLGQTATYTPQVITGPEAGYLYTWDIEGQRGVGPTFSPIFRTSGQKTLILTAKHPDHPIYRARAFINVESGDALTVRILGPSSAEAGQRVSFRPQVKGGLPPYRYSWVVDGRKVSKESVVGEFEDAGEHSVLLYVSDAQESGKPAVAKLTLKVKEKKSDLKVAILSPSEVEVGAQVQFSPKVRGGTPPYRYVWLVKGREVRQKTIKGTFDKPGEHKVLLAVYDSGLHNERPLRTTCVVSVDELDLPPLRIGISGPSESEEGAAVSFYPQVKGGTPPYRYVWLVKGREVRKRNIKGRFDTAGQHKVTLAIYDDGEYRQRPLRTTRTLRVKQPRRVAARPKPRPRPQPRTVPPRTEAPAPPGRIGSNFLDGRFQFNVRNRLVFRRDGTVTWRTIGGSRFDGRYSFRGGVLSMSIQGKTWTGPIKPSPYSFHRGKNAYLWERKDERGFKTNSTLYAER